MYDETYNKIRRIYDGLHECPDKEKKSCNQEDSLNMQVLAYLLLVKTVSVVDCSFVEIGIKSLIKKAGDNKHAFINSNRSKYNVYEIEKNLSYFSMPKKGLLNLKFIYFDSRFSKEYIFDPRVMIRYLSDNILIHPITEERISNFRDYVYPVYFPTQKLEELRVDFFDERECEVHECSESYNRNDRKERARALRILR
ncbi:hypothetical protein [Erwinia tasmaniensis]|uniref:hypothetical protein n=1 Tax=Erwinia tasmaniensis TaxID=338565 RepID=UPI003A4DAE4A